MMRTMPLIDKFTSVNVYDVENQTDARIKILPVDEGEVIISFYMTPNDNCQASVKFDMNLAEFERAIEFLKSNYKKTI